MKKRTFTSTITFPAGTSGQVEKPFVLDSRYQQSTGVAAYVNNDAGVPNFKLGLRSEAGDVYVQPTNVDYFKADASCPKNQRMTPINILCDKQNVYAQFVFPQPLSDGFNIDVVFELEG